MQGERLRYIVGIGASAGGLEALETFFAHIPADTGMAFVVIQHLTPDFKSLMDELLARHTAMPIHKVEQDMAIAPDSVYLIPPNKMMTIDAGRFRLTERDHRHVLNLPIDHFFTSLAEESRENAIGIVLSGTGSDGSRGIRAIHAAGGLVLCQSLETAHFDGMPNSALATGVVDLALGPAAMPQVLIDYAHHERTIPGHGQAAFGADDDADPLKPIFDILSARYGVDFQHYKSGTISRRVDRRMALHGVSTIDEYVDILNALPSEPLNLYRDLLIGVTEFFRDRDAWEVLEQRVIPQLCKALSSEREVRCWVPATATGEEAYSLAILFHEHLTHIGKPVNVRIFATDVHLDSLETAGSGIYPASSMTSVSPPRIARYFKRIEDEQYQVMPEIRTMVVFAKQNLIKDPPFTRLDLVTCRNAIIYFDQDTQHRVLSTFHFALNVGGCLFLGPSESLGDVQDEFETIDRHVKLFSKRRDVRLAAALRAADRRSASDRENVANWSHQVQPRQRAGRDITMLRTYDALLDRYVPPALLVDSGGDLTHTFNHATDYLRPRSGVASLNVLELVLPELRMALSTGMQRAGKEAKVVRYGGIRVSLDDDEERIVRVTIEAIGQPQPIDYFLITFEQAHQPGTSLGDEPEPSDAITVDQASVHTEHVTRLEQELRYTKEYLQATVEELETSNEELQATNEELMAANEELQSTNEELHSVNEELYTVNKEYESKIAELTTANDDMDNLLASTEIGTVFLDESLCIRRFTPAVARQFSLLTQDIGRPISHLNSKISFPAFLNELSAVLKTGEEAEHEVRDAEGNWFLMRVHPYRREAGGIGGVVVTFVEISNIKHTAQQLEQRTENMQGFAYAVSHELSEPVRMVSGFTRLLAQRVGQDVDEKTALYLEQIQHGAERLQEMLNGVLEYSRVMTRATSLEVVDFYDVVQEACERLGDRFERSGARLDMRSLPKRIKLDRRQSVRAVAELIDNAIRYSNRDHPHIRFEGELVDMEWIISMSDDGPGVPVKDREHIFEMFAHRAREGADPGFGVGLAIARRIAERHGGSLVCDGDDGGGARFELRLPALHEDVSQPAQAN